MRILDARQPGAMVKDIRQGDYIVFSDRVVQMRGDGRRTQSWLISNEPDQWLEAARSGAGRLLDSMDVQSPELAEIAAQAAQQPEEWDYDMMLASFEAGTGRV